MEAKKLASTCYSIVNAIEKVTGHNAIFVICADRLPRLGSDQMRSR
jgi:hypothetical protein